MSGRWRGVIPAAMACWLVVLSAGQARGADFLPVPPADVAVRTVHVVEPIALYVDPMLDPRQTGLRDLRLQSIAAELRRQVQTDLRYRLLERDDVRERLAVPSGSAEAGLESVAVQSARLGREYFQAFNLRAAIEQLEEAVSLFDRTRLRWATPDAVAEAYHVLGLAWQALAETEREDQDAARRHQVAARRAFREAWRIAPSVPFDRRAYPASVVETRDGAVAELLVEGEGDRLGMASGEARRLAQRVGADLLVDVHVVVTAQRAVFVLRLWDASEDRFIARSTHALVPETRAAQLVLTAALSRELCCLPTARLPRETGAQWEPLKPFLSVAPTLGFFAERPSRQLAPHAGVAVGLFLPLTSEFGLLVENGVEIVQRDAGGDLLRRVDTVRTGLAARIGLAAGRTRLHLDAGSELLYTGRIRATRSFWCQVSQGEEIAFDDERSCDPGALLSAAPQVAFGPMVALGGAYQLEDRLWFTFRVRTAAYVMPFASDRVLDLPLTSELGVGVQF